MTINRELFFSRSGRGGFSLFGLCLLSAVAACGGPTGQDAEVLEDVMPITDRPRVDVPTGRMDGEGPDASEMTDTGVGFDVPTGEGGMFDVPDPPADGAITAGRCTLVGSRQTLSQENRQQSRQVYVGANMTGYFASTARQNMGIDQINFYRFNAMGMMQGITDVVPDFAGTTVRGGAFIPTATGFTVVAASNFSMGLNIYAQRLDSNAARMGSAVQIVADAEISEIPLIKATSMGEVIVWRSTNDMIGDTHLFSSRLSGGAASAPVNISGMGVQVGSFDMAGDGTRTAVAFVARSNSNGNVMVASLNPNGTVARTATLTVDGRVSEAVSIAILGTDAVVAWSERRADGTLRARRVNLDTGVMGPEVVIPQVGLDISQVGIAPDLDGVAVVFRAANMMGGSIAMARLGPNLALREGVSRVGPGVAGDAVRVVAKGDRTFGVGWADETLAPMSTTTYFQVMQCP